MKQQPYYEDEHVTLYHGDCADILPHLPQVDLVLTDPPYGIGIASNPVRQKHERKDWDNAPPDYRLIKLVVKAGKQAIIWGGNYFALPPSQCFFIWDKQQPEKFSLAMVEMAWTNIKMPAKMFRKSVLSHTKEHPTEKPVSLMSWCIGKSNNPLSILDPFAGSGSTLRAAKDMGIKAIGIEREKQYCDVIVKRMKQQVLAF